MTKPLGPVSNLSVQIGLITQGAVGEFRFPNDAVTESINFKFNKIGSAKLRDGTTLLGTGGVLSGNILGLYEFRDGGAGTNNQIIAVNGTVLYYLSGSTWTSKRTGLTTGQKARFTTFLDFVWMVNNAEATAIWDGNPANSFVTTGNAASAPVGKFIENFRSRVWILGSDTYPDRVWFSSLPSAVTTPVVTWNTSVTTGDWIDVAPNDGENITGARRTRKALLVFKNNHIYPIYSISQTEPDPITNVGTYSNESIVETKAGIFFHHPSGFYRYSVGSEPEEISKPIIDIVNAITVANYSKVCGWLEPNGDNIVWAVGSCTINGVTYSNLEVRYTISTQTWTHYQKPTQALVASRYNDGSTLFQLIGDDSGNVLKMDVGTTDNGTAITYSLITGWQTIDGSASTRKSITKALFSHTGGAGTNVSYQTESDKQNPNDWKRTIGQLRTEDSGFNNINIKGQKFRFRISGSSVGEPFTYNGFEILEGNTELITFNG